MIVMDQYKIQSPGTDAETSSGITGSKMLKLWKGMFVSGLWSGEEGMTASY